MPYPLPYKSLILTDICERSKIWAVAGDVDGQIHSFVFLFYDWKYYLFLFVVLLNERDIPHLFIVLKQIMY